MEILGNYTSISQLQTCLAFQKLIKRGSGFGLNFSIPILEILEIDPEKDLIDVSIENGSLIIKKS